MNFIFAAILSVSAHAHTDFVQCQMTKVDGAVAAKGSRLSWDPYSVLLEINITGSRYGRGALFDRDTIRMADGGAIDYDRAKGCRYSLAKLADGSVSHTFDCGDDELKFKSTLIWNETKSNGQYSSVLSGPGGSTDVFSFEFENCGKKFIVDSSVEEATTCDSRAATLLKNGILEKILGLEASPSYCLKDGSSCGSKTKSCCTYCSGGVCGGNYCVADGMACGSGTKSCCTYCSGGVCGGDYCLASGSACGPDTKTCCSYCSGGVCD